MTEITDPRIAIANVAVAALPADVQALAKIDTTELPDPDFPAVVTMGDWYARVCHADHEGTGFVAYLGHDLYTAPTAAYAADSEAMAAVVANWINQPGPTYAETVAIEDELRLLARRLHAILRDGGDAAAITAEIRTLDPNAVLAGDPDGYAHLVTVHGHQLDLSYEADGRGWVWRWVAEATAAQIESDGPITVSGSFFQDLTDAVFPPKLPGHRSVMDHLREMYGEEKPPAA